MGSKGANWHPLALGFSKGFSSKGAKGANRANYVPSTQ